jgi:arylsulfatase A
MRRWCVITAASLALAVGPAVRAEPPPRPNVLVMLCDDLGYGDLACYGHETIRTPHLDELGRAGLRLTACYAAAPVCSPSRAGLMTGRVPTRTGVYDWIPPGNPMHLPRGEITVATCLARAGYRTAHFGKWHLSGELQGDQPTPADHGFETWLSTANNAAPSHRNPTNFVRDGVALGPQEGFACDLVASACLDWLREGREGDRPFFAFVCFHEPHEPIDSPAELVASYPEAARRGEALYYANVTNMDAAVGRLLEGLDELGLADSTLVFFTSDNGPETLDRYRGAWRSHGSAGPWRGRKLHLYEGGIRVPGLVRWPGRIAAGRTCDVPVSGVDLLPTLCALTGAEVPADRTLDGVDVSPVLLHGSAVERGAPLFWHYYRALGEPKVALRHERWMLLARLDAPDRGAGGAFRPADMDVIRGAAVAGYELYDLRSDPGQAADAVPSEPELLARLGAMLEARLEEVLRAGHDWRDPRPDDR